MIFHSKKYKIYMVKKTCDFHKLLGKAVHSWNFAKIIRYFLLHVSIIAEADHDDP